MANISHMSSEQLFVIQWNIISNKQNHFVFRVLVYIVYTVNIVYSVFVNLKLFDRDPYHLSCKPIILKYKIF